MLVPLYIHTWNKNRVQSTLARNGHKRDSKYDININYNLLNRNGFSMSLSAPLQQFAIILSAPFEITLNENRG